MARFWMTRIFSPLKSASVLICALLRLKVLIARTVVGENLEALCLGLLADALAKLAIGESVHVLHILDEER